MSIEEICLHEQRGMMTRRKFGHDQNDDHLWRWLNHHLRIWGNSRPIRITS